MSTLKVNTVQHNTTGFNNVVQFTDGAGTENGTLCRAWVNFNSQGTVAIRADFNVNTVGDNAVGDHTVNFTTALVDTNFCVLALNDQTDVNGGTVGNHNAYPAGGAPAGKTTSSVRVYSIGAPSNAYSDAASVSVAIFR